MSPTVFILPTALDPFLVPCVLMDKEDYISKCMNATTTLTPSNAGVTIEVSFCLTNPLALSYLCAHYLGLEGRTKHGG
jgi:hypothetical protein